MQPTSKPFQFHGTAGGYFAVTVISAITAYIPIFGWPFGFNYTANWVVDNLTVDGKKLAYTAGYGETLKFLFINLLLVVVTLGIYIFWFGPKMYQYITDHTTYVDFGVPTAAVPAPVSVPPVSPTPINPVV